MGRDDFHSLYSEQYEESLRDGLPEEMMGALQATAQAVNPNWSVTHFVWALEPLPADMAPLSYSEAVAPVEPRPAGPTLSRPKQVVLKFAYGSPRRAAAFSRLYNRLR